MAASDDPDSLSPPDSLSRNKRILYAKPATNFAAVVYLHAARRHRRHVTRSSAKSLAGLVVKGSRHLMSYLVPSADKGVRLCQARVAPQKDPTTSASPKRDLGFSKVLSGPFQASNQGVNQNGRIDIKELKVFDNGYYASLLDAVPPQLCPQKLVQ